MIGLLIYLLGCVLAYGRHYARFYEIEEDFPYIRPNMDRFFVHRIVITILSWAGFLEGVRVYFKEKQRYFLRYSYRKLKKKYEQTLK